MATARLTLRHLVAIGSAALVLTLGTAFFLVYQNAGIMLEQIHGDFNAQQLVLARHAAAEVAAALDAVVSELSTLSRRLPEDGRAIDGALDAVVARGRIEGLLDLGVLGAGGALRRARIDGGRATPAHDLAPTCAGGTPGVAALRRAWVAPAAGDRRAVLGVFCVSAPRPAAPRAVFATLDLSQLTAHAVGEIRSGKTGYAWVIDRTGLFLHHPDGAFVARSAFDARHERGPYISFSDINRIMSERMRLGEEGTGTYVSGWHRGEQGEMTKLIAFTPVAAPALGREHQWSIAVVAPVAEVAEAVYRVYVRHVATEAVLIAGMFLFGFVGVLYQRRLSQALARQMGKQERYMSSILQNSVDAIVFVDNDNRVQVWNRGAERIFGYTSEEMAGQTFHRLVPPDIEADEELRRIRRAIEADGYIKDYIAPRVTKDGRRITVDISRTNVRGDDGEVIGSTVIIRDVTEKTLLEQKIYNAEKLASIGILAAGVAHEINNPLAVMLGFTDLLLERFQPGTPEHDDLRMIAANGEHARKIVEDLLGFARITEGQEDTVDVPHCVDRVVGIVRNTLLTSKIELRIDLPPALPLVCGDPREFQQVIFNLVNNAVAAMPGGGELTIRASAPEGRVDLVVEDTGSGIPEEIQPRIFDPFFTTKPAGEGTGLGLSLCYGIVHKYGGTITFASAVAGNVTGRRPGTAFTVSMPVCGKAGAAATPAAPPAIAEATP